MTSIGLYAEELAARDRSPPCPENSVFDQTFDDSEMPLRRRNLTSRGSLCLRAGLSREQVEVWVSMKVEDILCESFIRDAPTATSTHVGSHVSPMNSVTRQEGFETSGDRKANGQATIVIKALQCHLLLFKALMTHYLNPRLC